MNISLFNEIALVLVTAGFFSLIAYLLRQPLMVGYIITGLLVGPSVLNITQSPEVFHVLSQIGIAFLLFLVGLNLNWRNIKDIGGVSLGAGFAQVICTSLIGYGVARALHFNTIDAWFLSIGFAFSSTIIVIKLLSDKRDMDRFYGRISIGTLIVQDIIALVVLIVLATMQSGGHTIGDIVGISLFKTVILVLGLILLSQYVLKPLFSLGARQQELLFILAISWCFIVSTITLWLGFGIEIGALLAGMSLSGNQYHNDIEHKIRPLRDFFLIIFFIVLGTNLSPDIDMSIIVPAMLFSLFVLFGDPLILLFVLRLFGYHPRTGFLVGMTMGQISEFSFIILAFGIGMGLISDHLLPLATIVAMITMVVSTYFMKYNEDIYSRIAWMFTWMIPEKNDPDRKAIKVYDIVQIGYETLGEQILPTIKKINSSYTIIDFNPSVVKALSAIQEPVIYGDAGNEDFLEKYRIHRAKMIICTIADKAVNRDILAYFQKKHSKAVIILTARTVSLTKEFYDAGASYVINPEILSGISFANMLKTKKMRKTLWKMS